MNLIENNLFDYKCKGEGFVMEEDIHKTYITDLVKENKELAQKSSLDKIWKFESADDIYLLINSYVKKLSEIIVCEKGVLEGFEWSINEVLDNVPEIFY